MTFSIRKTTTTASLKPFYKIAVIVIAIVAVGVVIGSIVYNLDNNPRVLTFRLLYFTGPAMMFVIFVWFLDKHIKHDMDEKMRRNHLHGENN